jgi:hypothetical protein
MECWNAKTATSAFLGFHLIFSYGLHSLHYVVSECLEGNSEPKYRWSPLAWCSIVCVCVCVRALWVEYFCISVASKNVTSTWQAWRGLSENVVWTVYICYCSLCSPETCTIPSTLCNAATMRQMFYSKRRKTHRSRKTTQRIAFYLHWLELPAVLSVCPWSRKQKASKLLDLHEE